MIPHIMNHISKRENIIDFMVDWCWTFDPRNANLGVPTSIPWIPWQQQVDFLEWVYNMYVNGERALADKSRDQGVTWLMCVFFLQEWRWVPGFAGGIGSNKLDNVDKRGNPDSIFEKLRALMSGLPSWWLPDGFIEKKHDKIGELFNPENNASISGQGGRDIGRGGRRSAYFVDEAASLDFPEEADNALSQNTNFQLDLSTPKGMNHFGQKRHSKQYVGKVFSFDWRNDPRKDQNWYDHEVATLDPVAVAQEIDRDYHASVDGLFIEPKWIRAAIELKLEVKGVCGSGLDVAAGGKNKSSLCIRRGPLFKTFPFSLANGIDLVHKTFGLAEEAGAEYMNFDEIGVGWAVESAADRSEMDYSFPHYGIRGGDTPSDREYPEFRNKRGPEVFYNKRAEDWYNLSIRFKKTYERVVEKKDHPDDECISIENNPELIAQLASPMKMHTDTGKIKCESKEQMLKRGVKSPDEADSMVLANSPADGGFVHAVSGYNDISPVYKSFEISNKPARQRTLHFGAVCLADNLEVHAVYAFWNEVQGHLYIHDESIFEQPMAANIAGELAMKMNMTTHEVERLMGNDDMHAEERRSLMREVNDKLYDLVGQVQNVKIRRPRKYDPMGSLAVLQELVNRQKITVHTNCRVLHRQMANRRLNKGKLKERGCFEGLLMIVSELKQVVPIEEVLKYMEYTTHLKESLDSKKENP